MGCGSCNSGGAIKGITPPQVRVVQGYQYTVQPGDRVSDICHTFGIPIRRWQELVGANLHKPLAPEAPYGYKHRCFANLEAGETLAVPATWKATPGAVSGPMLSQLSSSVQVDRIKQFVDVLMSTPIPSQIQNILAVGGSGLPSGSTIEDALAVVYSWWPYVKWPGWPGGPIPKLPTPANPTSTVSPDMLIKLGTQAVEFLRYTGITNGKSPQVQNIPWDAILWNDVPWNVLGTQTLQDLSQVMLGTPFPAYTTPAIAYGGQTPDFMLVDWSDESWADILKDVDFNDQIVDVLGDPDTVACIKKDPARLKKLNSCPQCYQDGVQRFKELLCSTEPADPCDCDEPGEPGPGDEPGPGHEAKDESNTALIVGGVAVGILAIVATATVLSGRGKK